MTTKHNARIKFFIIAYPLALVMAAVIPNLFFVSAAQFVIPDSKLIALFIVGSVLLLGIHSLLMTTTELTRLKFNLFATPEEWHEKGLDPKQASPTGIQELARQHNTHRNFNENSLHFYPLAAGFILFSPNFYLACFWLLLFPLARLGHCWAFLRGKDGHRGLFMSLSLLSLYGLASYCLLSLSAI